MPRILFLALASIVAVAVSVQAFSSGPPAQTVVSGDGCTCHSPNPNAATTVTVEAPTSYTLGQTYTIRVTSTTDVTSVGVNKGGFLSWASAGAYAAPSSNAAWYQTETLDGKSVIKHTSAGDQQNLNQAWEYRWTAPSTNVGTVTIKVWVNRVNGDGSASEADHWNRKHVTVGAPATSPSPSPPSSPTSSTPSSAPPAPPPPPPAGATPGSPTSQAPRTAPEETALSPVAVLLAWLIAVPMARRR